MEEQVKKILAKGFAGLFSDDELLSIGEAPLVRGTRHPTWFPVFYDKPSVPTTLVHSAVRRIVSELGGLDWLIGLKPRLLDFIDPSGASASLAEIRAYGGLLEAGFNVKPIPRSAELGVKTPDFQIDIGDGPVTVEVFSKHQDKEQDALLEAASDHSERAALPEGVNRSKFYGKKDTVVMTEVVLQPGGAPDPNKPDDSVQANVISRICSAKQSEAQLPDDQPTILIVDLAAFGPVPQFLRAEQASPLLKGHRGWCSGSLWYAFYGWKGAPIFEESLYKPVQMGHEGRFRMVGKKRSKLSGVVIVLDEACVFFENFGNDIKKLSMNTRYGISRLPWFDFPRSIADWKKGHCERKVALGQEEIQALFDNYETSSDMF